MSEDTKQSGFSKFADYMGKVGAKIGNQRHLSTIRDSFATFMPFIIIGALAIMINSVFIQQHSLLAYLCGVDATHHITAFENWGKVETYLSPIFNGISGATMSFFAIYIAFLFGYNLTGTYGERKIFGGMIALAAFLAFQPIAAGSAQIAGGNPEAFLGTGGVLFAMITGLTAPMLFVKLSKSDALKIRMPDGVPPAVVNSFMALIPLAIVLFGYALVQPLWYAIAHNTMGDTITLGTGAVKNVSYIMNAINVFLFLPLQNASTSIWIVLLVVFLMSLFWFFGIHGQNVMNPFVSAFWTVATIANVDAFSGHSITDLHFANHIWTVGGTQLNIWTEQTMNSFMMLGGNAATIGLIISTLAFSKNQASKSISSVALPSGIFEINEPMTFGMPIMLNPMYVIPYLVLNPILAGIAYLFTWMGWMAPTVIMLPWTTPVLLSGILSTLGWVSIIVTLINVGLSLLIYTPFVIADSKRQINAYALEHSVSSDEAIKMQVVSSVEEKVEISKSHVNNANMKFSRAKSELDDAKENKVDDKKVIKLSNYIQKSEEKLKDKKLELAKVKKEKNNERVEELSNSIQKSEEKLKQNKTKLEKVREDKYNKKINDLNKSVEESKNNLAKKESSFKTTEEKSVIKLEKIDIKFNEQKLKKEAKEKARKIKKESKEKTKNDSK